MPADSSILLFYSLVFVFAFLYAMVGHGGASAYLALMSLYSFAPEQMRGTALLLNLAVSLIAFVQYYRAGYFQWSLFWPLAITSVPAAFIGGLIVLDAGIYKMILAALLLFSSIRLFGLSMGTWQINIHKGFGLSLLFGGAIGLLSGMIGIGGGILLSPLLLLLKWSDVKQTAAVSALFIFVNSLSGMAGISIHGFHPEHQTFWMLGVAIAGGLAGAWLGSGKLSALVLRKILAFVLVLASVKLILT
ncbi:MAG TPA: sulfite exporter TauE/SafE family protein [Bacteroidia bacterium]|nr:sulfite exporter TauE/SafE family protein [Bacteroidia bacterium]